MIFIYKKLWKGMYIRKSGNWRKNHPKHQYNVRFALVTLGQRTLHERDPLRIDGHMGTSPLAFRFATHLTLVHQNEINSYKNYIHETPHQVEFNNVFYLVFGGDL